MPPHLCADAVGRRPRSRESPWPLHVDHWTVLVGRPRLGAHPGNTATRCFVGSDLYRLRAGGDCSRDIDARARRSSTGCRPSDPATGASCSLQCCTCRIELTLQGGGGRGCPPPEGIRPGSMEPRGEKLFDVPTALRVREPGLGAAVGDHDERRDGLDLEALDELDLSVGVDAEDLERVVIRAPLKHLGEEALDPTTASR